MKEGKKTHATHTLENRNNVQQSKHSDVSVNQNQFIPKNWLLNELRLRVCVCADWIRGGDISSIFTRMLNTILH